MSDLKNKAGYVDSKYLEKLAEIVAPIKKQSYSLMNITEGNRVLDVGCGTGVDTLPLAGLVGNTGQVFGIDHDQSMVDVANKRAQQAGVEASVTHQAGDAYQLPFEDNTFDACRSERVFQHVTEPERILAEMIRVTRPGGWVVVVDTDHSSVSFDTVHHDIEWKLRRHRVEYLTNGFSGRQLFGQFVRQGLASIHTEIIPMVNRDYHLVRYIALMDEVEKSAVDHGLVTPEELDILKAEQIKLHEAGQAFGYGVMIITAGQKPV